MITTDQLEDFITNNLIGKNIYDAEASLEKLFTNECECYDDDIDDKTDDGEYLMYRGYNCSTKDEYYDVTLYYVNDIVTDYRIR